MNLYVNETEKNENNIIYYNNKNKSLSGNNGKEDIKESQKDKKENEDKIFLEKNKEDLILKSIFFKKYKPIKQIGQGSFSEIYEGENILTHEKVAIKIEEKKNNNNQLLKQEVNYLYLLRNCPGIIDIISFGITKYFNILIEPLLGKNLYSLFLENKKHFSLKDICLISIQCINILENVHSKGIIHCDIKPENFAIGSKDKRVIYLFDFGLSKKFRSDRTKNHLKYTITKTMTGTARYASRNALIGLEVSRRDDLESLCYMILYFIVKKLPWQGISAISLKDRYKKIYYIKEALEQWEKFKKIPIQIQNFIKYCRNLKFCQEPDYKKMKNYFYDLMKENNIINDGDFSWILDKSILGSKLQIEYKRKRYFSIPKIKKLAESVNFLNLKNSEKLRNKTDKKYNYSDNNVFNNDSIKKNLSKSLKAFFKEEIGEFNDEKDKNTNNINM